MFLTHNLNFIILIKLNNIKCLGYINEFNSKLKNTSLVNFLLICI